MIVLKALLWIGSTLCLFSACLYVWATHSCPRLVVSMEDREGAEYSDRIFGVYVRWYEKVWFFGTLIGFAVFFYMGTKGMLGWMPLSWGGKGEDGEFTPLVDSIAGMVALGMAYGVCSALSRLAHINRAEELKRKREEEEREKKRQAYEAQYSSR